MGLFGGLVFGRKRVKRLPFLWFVAAGGANRQVIQWDGAKFAYMGTEAGVSLPGLSVPSGFPFGRGWLFPAARIRPNGALVSPNFGTARDFPDESGANSIPVPNSMNPDPNYCAYPNIKKPVGYFGLSANYFVNTPESAPYWAPGYTTNRVWVSDNRTATWPALGPSVSEGIGIIAAFYVAEWSGTSQTPAFLNPETWSSSNATLRTLINPPVIVVHQQGYLAFNQFTHDMFFNYGGRQATIAGGVQAVISANSNKLRFQTDSICLVHVWMNSTTCTYEICLLEKQSIPGRYGYVTGTIANGAGAAPAVGPAKGYISLEKGPYVLPGSRTMSWENSITCAGMYYGRRRLDICTYGVAAPLGPKPLGSSMIDLIYGTLKIDFNTL